MIILGIETSCDETSAAVVEGRKVLSNRVFSQIDTHRVFGGVVPEIAAREHLQKIGAVVDEALKIARTTMEGVDAIAATYGPGLSGALIVGLSYAKAAAYALKKPFIAVNHIEAHMLSPFIENDEMGFPYLALVVSGGHTNIYAVKALGEYELMGSTRDDAAGEAFDKAAKMLNLPYPGGPSVSKAAETGNPKSVIFPQAQMKDGSLDFSFSGLKTSLLYYLQKNRGGIESGEISINDVAASFQRAAVRALVKITEKAALSRNCVRICVAGGVAANAELKRQLAEMAAKRSLKLFVPSMGLCTDNGAMIAYTGGLYLKAGKISGFDAEVNPSAAL